MILITNIKNIYCIKSSSILMTQFLDISLERAPEESASLTSPNPCESRPPRQCSFFALRVHPEPHHPPPQALGPALPSLPFVLVKVDLASAPRHLCSFWDRYTLSAIPENANACPSRHKHPSSQRTTRDSCGLKVCCRVITGTVENSKFVEKICSGHLSFLFADHPSSLLRASRLPFGQTCFVQCWWWEVATHFGSCLDVAGVDVGHAI